MAQLELDELNAADYGQNQNKTQLPLDADYSKHDLDMAPARVKASSTDAHDAQESAVGGSSSNSSIGGRVRRPHGARTCA